MLTASERQFSVSVPVSAEILDLDRNQNFGWVFPVITVSAEISVLNPTESQNKSNNFYLMGISHIK